MERGYQNRHQTQIENNDQQAFDDEKFELAFYIGKNQRYHLKRQHFFNCLDNLTKIATYIIGSATIIGVLSQQYQTAVVIANIIVLILNAMDFVIGFGHKARDHKEFYQQYKKLELALFDAVPQDIQKIRKEIALIELNEPPILNVLMERSWNEEAAYQGVTELKDIAWYQTLFAHFFDLCPLQIVKKTANKKANRRECV